MSETAIHNVEAASFWDEDVKHVDLVHLAIRDMDKGRNITPEIKQGMEFDSGLGGAKPSKWEYRKKKVWASSTEKLSLT